MKINSFEDYLRDYCWEPEGVLDDDMPDAFDAWLAEISQEFLIDLATDYGKMQFLQGKINWNNAVYKK